MTWLEDQLQQLAEEERHWPEWKRHAASTSDTEAPVRSPIDTFKPKLGMQILDIADGRANITPEQLRALALEVGALELELHERRARDR